MSRLGVIGAGRVGLVVAACMARLGHTVVCIDRDEALVSRIGRGVVPFLEPDLAEIVRVGLDNGRLQMSTACRDLSEATAVFLAVDAPASVDGVDASRLRLAIESIVRVRPACMPAIVVKTTVAPGTTNRLEEWLEQEHGRTAAFVANPEFLREGSAVHDFMNPDRIVIGSRCREAAEMVADLYRGFTAPIVVTELVEAELIKLASNAFLATRVSLINEIAAICSAFGADIASVAQGVGIDHRIGPHYLKAGLGFGGSCLPKDLRILVNSAAASAVEVGVLPSVLASNELQISRLAGRLDEALGGLAGKIVTVLGVTFKPATDDIRESPALKLIDELMRRGASVSVCDPAGLVSPSLPESCLTDPYAAAIGCDAVIVATAWLEFTTLDYARIRQCMRGDLMFDACSALDPGVITSAGFRYLTSGRASSGTPAMPVSVSSPAAAHRALPVKGRPVQ